MEDKRVIAEQILAEIGIDAERMAQKVADAINNAQAAIPQRYDLHGFITQKV
jgi:hypothetical protein